MLTGSNLMEEKNPKRTWVRTLGLFGVIVSDLLGFTGAGVALGYLAWSKFGFPWWILLVTSLLGLAMAMYRLYKMSQRDML
jgi:F0F1-type ATP synthase assembly protein I